VLTQRAASQCKFEELKDLAIDDLTFLPPSSPKLDSQRELLILRGFMYEKLSKSLKSAPSDDEFWYRLAMWLKSENIREPEQVVPQGVYRRLTKPARRQVKKLGFFAAEEFNSYLVRIWLPYTEPLLRKSRWLRQQSEPPVNIKAALERMGFNPGILVVLEGQAKTWRSAVEFTCAVVSQRGGTADAATLRNAYSKIYGRMLGETNCSFCETRAKNEFWACGLVVPHCNKHGADQLPNSEDSAWTDRFGRRWWRDDLAVRYMMPTV
jgi:hypothetical protein